MASVSKHIKGIGIELEGMYLAVPEAQGYKATQGEYGGIQHDGSVKFNMDKFPLFYDELLKKSGLTGSVSNYISVGEVVSPVFYSVENSLKFLRDCYPIKSNPTCGYHIHLSTVHDGIYSLLMHNEFYEAFKKSLINLITEYKFNKPTHDRVFNSTEWAQKYCRDLFQPLKQAYVTQKVYANASPDRYTALNFCYGLHKTFECRIFTTYMPLKFANKALTWYVNFVDNYIEQNYENFANTSLVTENIDVETDNSFNDEYGVMLIKDEIPNKEEEEFILSF